jgi:GNAT superfamily N-acetyltransferase
VLTFCDVSLFPEGTIFELLSQSYRGLLELFPDQRAQLTMAWQETDEFACRTYGTRVARCFFLSTVGDVLVGMASFDPRLLPARAIVGQNCVLPAHRGRGFGRAQIEHVISLIHTTPDFAASTIIEVTTGSHEYFAPARRMYRSLGFVEAARASSDLGGNVTYALSQPAA